MPAILDRDEENSTRKKRLAKQKRGPGVFVYDGSAYDTESVPTIMLTGQNKPVFGPDGMPLLDKSGRQIYERAGQPVRDSKGQPMLGGAPEVVRRPITVFKVRGKEFPAGEEVVVDDPSLALKLRCLSHFTEVEPGDVLDVEPEADAEVVATPKKRGRKKAAAPVPEAGAEE